MCTKGEWLTYADYSGAVEKIVVKYIEHKERLLETIVSFPHASKEKEANARLIVKAVNACVKLNHNNPIAAAKSISDLYEALRGLLDGLGNPMQIPPCELVERASQALAKVDNPSAL